VLAVLGESPGLCADEICRVTDMDKVTVSRAVHALLDQGRVERQRVGSDGRRASIRLTRRGRAVYRRLVPLALSLEQQLLEGLNRSEKRQLDRILSKLIELAVSLEREETGA
jgi:DNA-binding MarR family transcriptional regulator